MRCAVRNAVVVLSLVIVSILLLITFRPDRSFSFEFSKTSNGARQTDGKSIELVFADPFVVVSPGDRCEVKICTRLLQLIQEAKTSIDFAVYGMRDQTQLLGAVVAAQARGVIVRGVVSRDRNVKSYYRSTDLWVERLGNANVQDDRAMHNKFFVIDQRWVWTGSANISDTGTGGYNANIVAVVDSPRLAGIYTEEFEQMWSGPSKKSNDMQKITIGDAEAEIWFSPQDKAIRNKLQPLIDDARSRIDLAIFYLTHKGAAEKLIAAHKRGVGVRVIVDATSVWNKSTRHEWLREAGIPVKVENWGSKMHMKAAAIDGRTIVVGSMNWSVSGAEKNDENTLIVHSPELAVEFESVFERLWDSIPQKWSRPGAKPDPESPESSPACTDGIDNDFDKLVDDEDPGCKDTTLLNELTAFPS